MGCAQSRIENEESVSRCKERKILMKEAVVARNAFAAAHSSYTMSLKNTGAALSDFGQGEAPLTDDHLRPPSAVAAAASSSSAAAVQPPIDTLPPPPPPLPDFSPDPILRSASMPYLSKTYSTPAESTIQEEDETVPPDTDDNRRKPVSPPPPPPPPQPSPSTPQPPPPPPESTWDYFFPMYDHIAEEIRPEREDPPKTPEKTVLDPPKSPENTVLEPPVTPEKVVLEPPAPPKPVKKPKQGVTAVHHQHAASAGVLEIKRGKMAASAAPPSLSLFQVLTDLDDHFLKAYQSAHEVSKMLEANRMHYHSNFADNRGHIDHSARVMQVITWNRSFKGIPSATDGKNDLDNDKWETHATVLDKMLAWEKKLYEEVKAGELMKIDYQRKVALLNRQKKRGVNPEAIEKTKAAVSHLHTRYIVDMQSLDSTVVEIQHLRDHQLYPKLVELVGGMANMWETMNTHHVSQLAIVADLRALDISNAPKETSEQHYRRTVQLYEVVREWHAEFQKLITHQKEYIHSLNSWLKLNLIPTESSLKEKVSSPPRPHNPPIQALLHAWHDHLEKLPDALALSAIMSFSAVVNTIVLLQQEELKQKEKYEEARKEYVRKSRSFEDWYHKNSHKLAAQASEQENPEGGGDHKDPVAEKRFAVEASKTRLDDHEEEHKKLCRQVREKTLASLKTHLPELFRAMSDFSFASSEMYKNLRPDAGV